MRLCLIFSTLTFVNSFNIFCQNAKITLQKLCDSRSDCSDGIDEKFCDGHKFFGAFRVNGSNAYHLQRPYGKVLFYHLLSHHYTVMEANLSVVKVLTHNSFNKLSNSSN